MRWKAVARKGVGAAASAAFLCFAGPVLAADGPAVMGIPLEFILFAATLLGVALFHRYVLQVALTGLLVIATYKIVFSSFKTGEGVAGFASHMAHEWVLLANLFGLLVGFALLARHFEDSGVPARTAVYRRCCRGCCRLAGWVRSSCSP